MTASTRTPRRLLKLIGIAVLIAFALIGGYATIAAAYDVYSTKAKYGTASRGENRVRLLVPEHKNLLSGQPLLAELQKGGLVIYMRHFHTDHRKFHEDPIKKHHLKMTLEDFKNTADKQRHLTEYGRQRATLIHDAMTTFNVPIGKVISSPYHRAIDGATLLAGHPPDLITKDLLHRGGDWTEAMMVKNIRPYLTTPPDQPGNTILMSHRPQMDGIDYIEEGQMFVFRPLGNGKFDMIGGIHDTDWIEAQVDIKFLGKRYAEFTAAGADTGPGENK